MTVTKPHQSNTCDRGIRDDDNPCVSMNIGLSQLPGLGPGIFRQAAVWACGSETDSRTRASFPPEISAPQLGARCGSTGERKGQGGGEALPTTPALPR